MVRSFLIALAVLLATTAHADAAPVGAAIAAIASTIGGLITAGGLVGALVKAAIGIALNVGVSLLRRALREKPKQPGVQGNIAVGGDNPLSFIMGWYATAGQLEYVNTGGDAGDTPNAYLSMVISLSDLPVEDLKSRLWVNGEPCTINFGSSHAEYGHPVTEYNKDGTDYLWVKFYDGTQTTPDSYLRARFGSDSSRPWRNTMIGRGVAYAIVTSRFNRNLFTGPPQCRFELEGIKLYDPRNDTSVGGSGSQRWDDPSTWAYSDNPVVMIYNILRGVWYGSQWMFGLQQMTAARLPLGNWFAAMNACEAGTGNTGFKAGLEVRVNTEPFAVIESLLDACNGRMAEIGGVYKIHVGEPGAAVYSFTDDDIVVTDSQTFDPFPGLDQTYNGIHASYPEPEESWESKDAPARYDSALEEEDGDRRLVADVQFPAVPYGAQVQRLMVAMLSEERRFRRHIMGLPPEAWLLEPNDTVSLTSTRFGYSNKLFRVVGIDGAPGYMQTVSLKEIDPDDYDWDDETNGLPYDTGFLGPIVPPAQPMVGWTVEAASITDGDGESRRPSIRITFAGDKDDVRDVRVQVRVTATQEVVFDGELPYGDPDSATKSIVLNATFLPNTSYQARGKFIPFSARETEWSEWLSVTTGDIPITDILVTLQNLRDDVYDTIQNLHLEMDSVRSDIEMLAIAGSEMGASQVKQTGVAVRIGDALAGAIQTFEADIDDLGNAQAALTQAVSAVVGDLESGVLWRMTTEAGSGDVVARVVLQVRATVGDDWVSAATVWEAGFTGGNPAAPFGRIVFNADQFILTSGSNEYSPFAVDAGVVYIDEARIRNLSAVNIQVAGVETESIALNAVIYPYLTSYGSDGPTTSNTATAVTKVKQGATVDLQSGFINGTCVVDYLFEQSASNANYYIQMGVWDVTAAAYLPYIIGGGSGNMGSLASVGSIIVIPFMFVPPSAGEYRFDLAVGLQRASTGSVTMTLNSVDIAVMHAQR